MESKGIPTEGGSFERLSQCILCDSPQIESACERNHFFRCGQCGHVFDNPRPTWESIAAFYSQNDKYDDWLQAESLREDLWKRRLKLVLSHRREGRLLDVGAGIGQFLNLAQKHFQVQGTEISTTAVRIAKEKYGITLNHGSLEDLPAGEPFDIITLFHVFEHVPFPAKTLALCYRLLAEGGILVLAVPNDVDSMLTRRNRFMSKLGFRKYLSQGKLGLPRLALDTSEIHLSHFTAETLVKAVERAGLTVMENSLDPYFVAGGLRKFRRFLTYQRYRALQKISGQNLYDTIWLVARKPRS
jgi:2-polyprenyl-3-methyl-5-hydroxy-6-metoxy-1,4-benzoquinol methylase